MTTVCTIAGCPNDAIRRGRCPTHAREQDAARPRTNATNGWAWQRTRARLLTAHPTCQRCHQRPSSTAHHLGHGSDDTHLLAVCQSCHHYLHAHEDRYDQP